MNILFLFYAPMLPYVGGIQRVTENLAKEMKRRGHNVCYLSSNSDDRDVQYNYPVPQFFLDETLDKDSYFASYQRLLKENNVEIVINQEPREDMLELLAHTTGGIKKITCCHLQPFFILGNTRHIVKYYRTETWKAKLFRFFCLVFPVYYSHRTLIISRKSFKLTLDVSNLLCLLSERFISRMVKYMPDIDTSRIVAINNPNTFETTDKSCCEKEKLVLWVGRQTNSQKNFPLFIDYWVLFQKHNPEWKAIVLGEGPDLENNKRYASHKSALNIEFMGTVKDVASYYQKATFLVMTSTYEGWGMILTEAMNYGCIPCAFDTYESLHDIVDDGLNGIIVPQKDFRQMCIRTEELLADASSLKAMQMAAIEKTKKFTVDKIVDQWETIFNTF